MKEFRGEAALTVRASADAAYALITDVRRLPEWNDAIERVVADAGELVTGAEWTVRMHPPHMPSWGSVSRVDVLDRGARTFSYSTRNADGNPSSVVWHWTVEPTDHDHAVVRVRWHCMLRTLDRRLLAGPMRKRQLEREVPRSLAALSSALESSTV